MRPVAGTGHDVAAAVTVCLRDLRASPFGVGDGCSRTCWDPRRLWPLREAGGRLIQDEEEGVFAVQWSLL